MEPAIGCTVASGRSLHGFRRGGISAFGGTGLSGTWKIKVDVFHPEGLHPQENHGRRNGISTSVFVILGYSTVCFGCTRAGRQACRQSKCEIGRSYTRCL